MAYLEISFREKALKYKEVANQIGDHSPKERFRQVLGKEPFPSLAGSHGSRSGGNDASLGRASGCCYLQMLVSAAYTDSFLSFLHIQNLSSNLSPQHKCYIPSLLRGVTEA